MNLPNHISLLRIILVPIFIACLVYYREGHESLRVVGAVIFTLACVTDAVDGFVAQRFNLKTKLGSYIDPLADKILLVSAFLTMSFLGRIPHQMQIPAWLTIAVISRDVIILFGVAIIFMSTGNLTPKPLIVGKMTTGFQMFSILVALFEAPAFLQMWVYGIAFALTVISGIGYLRFGTRLLQGQA